MNTEALIVDQRLVQKLGLKVAYVISRLHADAKYEGNFQEVNDAFVDGLGISMFQFREIRKVCKVLGLVELKRIGRPNRTHISLKLERYNEILTSEQTDYGVKIK